ncbi:ABC transporter permease [Paenibacillus wulumuqiensis]|uniref:ABC transporter permease n=1 Tax=Paenibacillus wulumuqiensis TaxID=1567107 RepID=UPI0006194194|nr:ABC transporter permease [Paenibacillus wulumuqiensis]
MIRLFRYELQKLKRTRLIGLITIAPLFMVFQGVQNFIRYQQIWTREAWEVIMEQTFIFYPSFLHPLLIAVIMAMVARIDHVQGGWKYLLARPVARHHVYMAKLAAGVLYILISMLIFGCSIILGGLLAGAGSHIPYGEVAWKLASCFLVSLPIILIQYELSIRFNHVGVPLAVGIVMSVPSIFAANAERLWILDPWTYPIVLSLGSQLGTDPRQLIIMGIVIIVVSVLILTGGLLGFRRRDIL